MEGAEAALSHGRVRQIWSVSVVGFAGRDYHAAVIEWSPGRPFGFAQRKLSSGVACTGTMLPVERTRRPPLHDTSDDDEKNFSRKNLGRSRCGSTGRALVDSLHRFAFSA